MRYTQTDTSTEAGIRGGDEMEEPQHRGGSAGALMRRSGAEILREILGGLLELIQGGLRGHRALRLSDHP